MEKEIKTKQKYEAHILGLQTSKYMSRLRGERASHMGKGTEVDEGKHREKPNEFGRARSLNQELQFCRIGVDIGLKIVVHIIGRALSDLLNPTLHDIGLNYWKFSGLDETI